MGRCPRSAACPTCADESTGEVDEEGDSGDVGTDRDGAAEGEEDATDAGGDGEGARPVGETLCSGEG